MDYFIIAPNNDTVTELKAPGEGGRRTSKTKGNGLGKKNKGSLKVKIKRITRFDDEATPRKTSEEQKITNSTECKGMENGPTPVTELTNLSCHCRRKCENLVREEERKIVFCHFSRLIDHQKQNSYIRRSIKCCGVKRRRSQSVQDPNTSNRHKYYIKTSRGDILVCKTFFASTLNVSEKRIDQVLTGLEAGKAWDSSERRKADFDGNRDRRLKGSMSKKHKLNWKKMFRLYLEKCREKNLSPVSVSTFIYLLINS